MCSRSALTSSDNCTLFAAVRPAELTDPISHSADRGGSSRNTVSPGKWALVSPGEDRTNGVQDVSQCVCAEEHGVEKGPPGSAIAMHNGVDRLELCMSDRRGCYDARTETASAKSGESRFVLSRARGARRIGPADTPMEVAAAGSWATALAPMNTNGLGIRSFAHANAQA